MEDTKLLCEGVLSTQECYNALQTFSNGKSPGNDGLTAEFYKTFWDLLGQQLTDTLNYSYLHGELSNTQKQAIIKLIEKKERDRRYIKNWRPISLLNVDVKIASRAIALRLEKLPETHLEAQMMSENGDFGVQRNTKHGFAQLSVDQTIKQTLNRSKGKKRAFETVRDSQGMTDSAQVIGENLTMSGQSITRLQEVVCMLYNDTRCKLVNDLRNKMFCKGKNVQSHQLPPTSAALRYHLKRANYQVFLWKKALQPGIEQEPVSHGWKLKEGRHEIVWTDLAPSPQVVMETVCCGCRGIRQTRRCSCVG
ncbi:hypothetical protein ACROYT_G013225 [Oculina patagonica]